MSNFNLFNLSEVDFMVGSADYELIKFYFRMKNKNPDQIEENPFLILGFNKQKAKKLWGCHLEQFQKTFLPANESGIII